MSMPNPAFTGSARATVRLAPSLHQKCGRAQFWMSLDTSRTAENPPRSRDPLPASSLPRQSSHGIASTWRENSSPLATLFELRHGPIPSRLGRVRALEAPLRTHLALIAVLVLTA